MSVLPIIPLPPPGPSPESDMTLVLVLSQEMGKGLRINSSRLFYLVVFARWLSRSSNALVRNPQSHYY